MAENLAKEGWEPKIVAVVCNWCTYAGRTWRESAGFSTRPMSGSSRSLHGKNQSFYIMKALQEGADGVLVSGCHPGECHYLTGI